MALGTFVGIGFCLFITSPYGASANVAAIGQTTGGMTGPNPGYKITWTATDGECVSTGPGGTPSVPWEYPTTGESKGSATYAFGMASGGSSTQAAGPGSTSCSGTITATFTWDDDDPEKVIPPPPVVVLHEYAVGYASGETREASSDIPQTGGYEFQYDILVEGERYEVINNPGPSFQRSVQPSAEATVPENSPPPLVAAFAGVAYEVVTIPARMVLQGVVDPITDKRLITGQLLKATVEFASPSSEADTKYTWQAPSGGAPFADYIATNSLGDEVPYTVPPVTGETSNTTQMYFNEQVANISIGCGVELVDKGISFTVSENFATWRSLITIEQHPVHGDFFVASEGPVTNPPSPPVINPPNPDWLWFLLQLPSGAVLGGYMVKVRIDDPPNFGLQVGKWNYTQLVTPTGEHMDTAGQWHSLIDDAGVKGLDKSFPYPNYGSILVGGPHTCSNAAYFSDSPRIGLLPFSPPGPDPVVGARHSGVFELYVMYLPPPNFSYETRWVSRYLFNWTCNGTAIKTNGVWSRTENGGSPGADGAHYAHPEWTFAHL